MTEELQGLLEGATKGPWRTLDQYIDTDTGPLKIATGWYDHMVMKGGEHHEAALANAALIVAAVNALPNLLASLTAKDTEIAALRAALEPFAKECARQERVTNFRDGDCIIPRSQITIGQLRRATRALHENPESKA